MNLGKFIAENSLEESIAVDTSPELRKQEVTLTKILEAIDKVASSSYYKILEQEVFIGLVTGLDQKLRKEDDHFRSAWLQGALNVAEKYADFKKFGEAYRLELSRIRKQLHG